MSSSYNSKCIHRRARYAITLLVGKMIGNCYLRVVGGVEVDPAPLIICSLINHII